MLYKCQEYKMGLIIVAATALALAAATASYCLICAPPAMQTCMLRDIALKDLPKLSGRPYP